MAIHTVRAALCLALFGQALAVDVEWTPTILKMLGANLPPPGDGGGVDEYFRASGMVVADGSYWTVNGVHPSGGADSLTASLPKSVVKVSIETDEIEEQFPFSTAFGHDVDMEGLAWGPDGGATYIYIGDEYNFMYQMELATGSLTRQWDVGTALGISTQADKGIESLTYSTASQTFFAGIQDTLIIHEFTIDPEEDCTDACTVTENNSFASPEAPSGMFYSEDEDLLYILCGTQTNGDQFLYVFTTTGTEECFVTIPEAVGLSRTDGFFIDAAAGIAYIADSQGPIYADDGSLGFNVYQVEWDNPCGTASTSSDSASASTIADSTTADSPEGAVEGVSGADRVVFSGISVTGALATIFGMLAL